MACLLFVWVSAFPLFFRDVYKKERKAALCECKVMAFLYGVQYPNVGIFCVFVVYICVYASFSGDLREPKWRDALFCGYYSRFVKNFLCGVRKNGGAYTLFGIRSGKIEMKIVRSSVGLTLLIEKIAATLQCGDFYSGNAFT